MLRRIGMVTARISRQIIPNPFIFAIVLTAVVYVVGLVLTDSGPFEMVQYWYGGFWNLLEFSMQMVVILLFGYVLASSPPVRRGIERAARWPTTRTQAVVLVASSAAIFGFLSWGLGLIVGAILARQVADQARQRGLVVHYPLLVAAGFTGLLVFNNGLSASAPLLVATDGHFLVDDIGVIPISQTILTPYNLLAFLGVLVFVPIAYARMHPRPEDSEQFDLPTDGSDTGPRAASEADRGQPGRVRGGSDGGATMIEEQTDAPAVPAADQPQSVGASADGSPAAPTLADRMEHSAPLTWLTVLAGGSFIVWQFATEGFNLDLNFVNFILLMLGLVAYRTPIAYVEAVDEGIGATGQIVLQFPFYAGIMGMMASSGLIAIFAEALVSVSNEFTFPLAVMASSAIVNLFVPSAGGQWAVQGPLVVQAAQSLNVDMGQAIVAFGYGDQLTNALQPMWMLPLLGVTQLKAGDILGYTAVVMLVVGTVYAVSISVLPLLFS